MNGLIERQQRGTIIIFYTQVVKTPGIKN